PWLGRGRTTNLSGRPSISQPWMPACSAGPARDEPRQFAASHRSRSSTAAGEESAVKTTGRARGRRFTGRSPWSRGSHGRTRSAIFRRELAVPDERRILAAGLEDSDRRKTRAHAELPEEAIGRLAPNADPFHVHRAQVVSGADARAVL